MADLFRTRAFLLGRIVAAVAWALHIGAHALAPLSVVQALLCGGLVLLAVLADRHLGLRVGRRQRIGVLVSGIGGRPATRARDVGSRSPGAPAQRQSAAVRQCRRCERGPDGDPRARRRGDRVLRVGRRLQLGPGVEVIALTSIAANGSAILGGHGPREIGARLIAICLAVAGAAFMPAPVRESGREKNRAAVRGRSSLA